MWTLRRQQQPQQRQDLSSMLVLDNEKIRTVVLGNGKVLEAFPQLYPLRQRVMSVSGCSSCQRGRLQTDALQAIETARRTIGQLPAADKERLKTILGVDKIRVYWQGGYAGHETRERADF